MLAYRFLATLALAFFISCTAPLCITTAAAAPAKAKAASKAKSKAKPAEAAAPGDALVWRGDHATGRTLMEDIAKEYAKEKKGKITLQPFSTLSGLDAVANGTADFAGSARGKYHRRAEEAGLDFLPVALDAAVVITYPRNPVNNITLKQLHDIYLGHITNWKELGGEDKPINLYAVAAELDGVEYSLRELVFARGDQRVAAPRLFLNTSKLEDEVTLDPAGLGLSTLAGTYLNKGVKALNVEGVAPSTASVADGSYPLYITLYLVTRKDSPKQEAINRFIAFLDTPTAKDIARKHQLVPVSDVPDLSAHIAARNTYIDEHMGRAAGTTASYAAAAAAAQPETQSPSAATPAPDAAAQPAPAAQPAQAAAPASTTKH